MHIFLIMLILYKSIVYLVYIQCKGMIYLENELCHSFVTLTFFASDD